MKGQTLIEVLIALGVVAVIVSSIAALITTSLSNAQFGRNQNQASVYGQEGMELVRRIRDSDYPTFTTYTGTYCVAKDQTTLGVASGSCTTPNIDTLFIRSIQIEQGGCGVNLARVIVSVSWNDSKCQAGNSCHKSQLSSCFSTVNPIQGP